MAQRRFGPTLGAGVVVIETDADKILEAAPLGVTAYPAILQSGDLGKLISTFSKKQFIKKCGTLIAESTAPDACLDFWDHSAGAGELHLIRVTDGTGRKASWTFYSRGAVMVPVAKFEAHNVGRWGGRRNVLAGEWSVTATDLTETTIVTGLTMKLNEWKGGFVALDGVAGKTYEVVSNTIAGIVTVRSDSKMKTDYGVASDKGYSIVLADNGVNVSLVLGAAEVDALNLFSLTYSRNGGFVKRYPNLSLDPTSPYYFVKLINEDDGNDELLATDLNAPASVVPDKRPAAYAGTILTVTTTVLTRNLLQMIINSPTGGNPTVAVGTTSDVMKYRAKYTITMTAATAFTITESEVLGGATAGPAGTFGALYTPASPLLPPFTITAGATPMVAADTIVLEYFPFTPSELIGGYVYPDHVNNPLDRFRITANDHKAVTVSVGDLTSVGAVSDRFMIENPVTLKAGYDGADGVTDANYTTQFDIAGSQFNKLIDQNKGLVKLGCPGKTATAITKAGLDFAAAKNWQYRVEVPDNIVTESSAQNHINTTIGRSDFGVGAFPSFADVNDPERPGMTKRIPLTGAIHGREALVAKNFDGYHKAAAGTGVTLPRIVALPTPESGLNEELLNPLGLQVIKLNKGNFIVWGDRTIALDPAWKFKHTRETIQHYENRLREGFDWIIFELNNATTDGRLFTTLRAFFLPEFTKGAIVGSTLDEAARIKLDGEINTPATRATGDLNVEIEVDIVDSVERLVIRISQAGIFDSTVN